MPWRSFPLWRHKFGCHFCWKVCEGLCPPAPIPEDKNERTAWSFSSKAAVAVNWEVYIVDENKQRVTKVMNARLPDEDLVFKPVTDENIIWNPASLLSFSPSHSLATIYWFSLFNPLNILNSDNMDESNDTSDPVGASVSLVSIVNESAQLQNPVGYNARSPSGFLIGSTKRRHGATEESEVNRLPIKRRKIELTIDLSPRFGSNTFDANDLSKDMSEERLGLVLHPHFNPFEDTFAEHLEDTHFGGFRDCFESDEDFERQKAEYLAQNNNRGKAEVNLTEYPNALDDLPKTHGERVEWRRELYGAIRDFTMVENLGRKARKGGTYRQNPHMP